MDSQDLFYYSTFVYTCSLFSSMFFANRYERSKGGYKKINLYLSFLSVLLLCGLRFFVGNDYDGYFDIFHWVKEGRDVYVETGYYFINRVFSYSNIGYIYVLFVACLITLCFIFKVMVRENILFYGIFFIFTTGLLIMTNDQVRQGIALSIFLYSIKFIENRDFVKYLIVIVSASILFHFSVIVLLPLYYIGKIKLSPKTWLFLILLFTVLSLKGIFNSILFLILEYIPIYQKYKHIPGQLVAGEVSTGLGILYHVVIILPVALYSNRINRPVITNIVLLGLISFLISKDFLITKRLAFYMLFTDFIALSLLFKIKSYKFTLLSFVKSSVLIICLTYFFIQNLCAKEQFGAIPYRTFLFETNLENPNSEYLND